MLHIHEVNLQRLVGGGEVYTRSFTRALADAGARVTLYVRAGNPFWDTLAGERIERVAVASEEDFLARLPEARSIVLTQGPISRAGVKRIAEKHFVAGVAHLPIQGGRDAEEFRPYHMVLGVSQYCIDLLRRVRLDQTWLEPMYGVADAARGDPAAPITAASPYQWDRRKARDRLLGSLDPLAAAVRPRTLFERKSGLTLGIVSLIVPIKQFPLLFARLAPILARHDVNLEIFGAGGFAQVRDLKRALAPMGARVRFWGYQDNVAAIYPRLDYLMTGLAEKEALGLNILEAQSCGTPVLAPKAPPFIETVLDGTSGFLYRDPREDGGADFQRVIAEILKSERRPDPRAAVAHLAQFSYPALVERVRRLIEHFARTKMPE